MVNDGNRDSIRNKTKATFRVGAQFHDVPTLRSFVDSFAIQLNFKLVHIGCSMKCNRAGYVNQTRKNREFKAKITLTFSIKCGSKWKLFFVMWVRIREKLHHNQCFSKPQQQLFTM